MLLTLIKDYARVCVQYQYLIPTEYVYDAQNVILMLHRWFSNEKS